MVGPTNKLLIMFCQQTLLYHCCHLLCMNLCVWMSGFKLLLGLLIFLISVLLYILCICIFICEDGLYTVISSCYYASIVMVYLWSSFLELFKKL